jgi:hypothetical protein
MILFSFYVGKFHINVPPLQMSPKSSCFFMPFVYVKLVLQKVFFARVFFTISSNPSHSFQHVSFQMNVKDVEDSHKIIATTHGLKSPYSDLPQLLIEKTHVIQYKLEFYPTSQIWGELNYQTNHLSFQ